MLSEGKKEKIYQHFVDQLPVILRTAEDMARVGIVPPTETAVLNTYVELSLFYALTVGWFIGKSEGLTEQSGGEVESTFILSLISLDIGTSSWQREANIDHLFDRLAQRKPAYRNYWSGVTSETSPTELLKLLADVVLEVGMGHAKDYEDKLFNQVFHEHTSRVVKTATASYDAVLNILSQK